MKVKIIKKYSTVSDRYYWTVYLNDLPIKCLFKEKEVTRLINNDDALRDLITKSESKTIYEKEVEI